MEPIEKLDIDPVIKLHVELILTKLFTDWFKFVELFLFIRLLDWLLVLLIALFEVKLLLLSHEKLSLSCGKQVSTIASKQSTKSSTFSGFSLPVENGCANLHKPPNPHDCKYDSCC
jgi:hypothetical protein